MVLDFLAGYEIDGDGVAVDASAVGSTATGASCPATGPERTDVVGATTPSLPVIELNPKNAANTKTNERAAFEDF
jgi:hypothetical protein